MMMTSRVVAEGYSIGQHIVEYSVAFFAYFKWLLSSMLSQNEQKKYFQDVRYVHHLLVFQLFHDEFDIRVFGTSASTCEEELGKT